MQEITVTVTCTFCGYIQNMVLYENERGLFELPTYICPFDHSAMKVEVPNVAAKG